MVDLQSLAGGGGNVTLRGSRTILTELPDVSAERGALPNIDQPLTWGTIVDLLVDHSQFKPIKPQLNNRQVFIDIQGIWKDTL